jgi:hypothetical protein
LFALSSQTIFYGSYSIARSLSFVFFICWMFLILKAGKDRRYLFLSLIAAGNDCDPPFECSVCDTGAWFAAYVCQIIVNQFRRERPLDPLFIYLLTIGAVSYLIWVASV